MEVRSMAGSFFKQVEMGFSGSLGQRPRIARLGVQVQFDGRF
jgi:hypothetical protein